MGVSKIKSDEERGQSVLEFLLILPMLVGLVVILIRVNTAIQISIVNQQYTREHILFDAMNSPYYPSAKLRGRSVGRGTLDNQVVMGISDKRLAEGADSPDATVQYVARRLGQGSDEPKTTPPERASVRVRNTVTLCANTWALRLSQNSMQPDPVVDKPYALNENTKFDYCGSILTYE